MTYAGNLDRGRLELLLGRLGEQEQRVLEERAQVWGGVRGGGEGICVDMRREGLDWVLISVTPDSRYPICNPLFVTPLVGC